jgi:hypothetical protein
LAFKSTKSLYLQTFSQAIIFLAISILSSIFSAKISSFLALLNQKSSGVILYFLISQFFNS